MAFNKQQAKAPHDHASFARNTVLGESRFGALRPPITRLRRGTSLVERLEDRRLFAFNADINFQPHWSSTPWAYYPDTGASFGPRFGIAYGWNIDNSANMVRRFQASDIRYDSFAEFGGNNQARTWEIEVPNGTYDVTVSAGDPASTDAFYSIDIEGNHAVSDSPSSNDRWLDRSTRVSVADGRLTVSSNQAAWNNRINFISIRQRDGRSANQPTQDSPSSTPTAASTSSAPSTPPPAAPARPWGALVSNGNGSDLTLSWLDASENEQGFHLELSTDANNWNRIGTISANVMSFTATGLQPNTRYWFRVQAFNDAGSSDFRQSGSIITGSSQSNPNPTPTPTPTPTPAPSPIPQPTPQPAPVPSNNGGSLRPVVNDPRIANRYDRITFQDEFNGWSLDQSKWRADWLGRRRHAINTADAVSVENGDLVIRTYTEGGQHYTGVVTSKAAFEQRYGFWEARIDFDSSPGMWSAFWVHSWNMRMNNPKDSYSYLGTEMDVVEHRAVDWINNDISGSMHSAVHWDGYGPNHQQRSNTTGDLGIGRGYHVYGLEWTPTEVRTYLNGNLIWTYNMPVSQVPHSIILSSEVQNGFWAGTVPGNGYGSRSETKTLAKFDYVRVFASSNPIT